MTAEAEITDTTVTAEGKGPDMGHTEVSRDQSGLHRGRRRALKRRCSGCMKRRFRDHAEAIDALHRACDARHRAALDDVSTMRREIRTYECDACKGWHLTSKATWGTIGTRSPA